MPRKYPSLKPREVRPILKALGFVHDRTEGAHEQWVGPDGQVVTVDAGYDDFSVDLIKKMIRQSKFDRVAFYRATKKTAKKIN